MQFRSRCSALRSRGGRHPRPFRCAATAAHRLHRERVACLPSDCRCRRRWRSVAAYREITVARTRRGRYRRRTMRRRASRRAAAPGAGVRDRRGLHRPRKSLCRGAWHRRDRCRARCRAERDRRIHHARHAPPYAPSAPRQMLATVKIIPFAAPARCRRRSRAHCWPANRPSPSRRSSQSGRR